MPTIDINDAYILDNTGRQVDDSVDYANANANRNLLDNGFFTIRQRGEGPFTGNVYGVDRWRGSNSRTTVTPNTGYITLATNSSGNGLLRQILSKEYDGPLTFSAYVRGSGAGLIELQDSGGTQLAQEEFSNPGNDWTLISVTYQGGTPVASVRFRVDVSTSYEIKCAKLEHGIYSTLVNDDPPDYGTEYRKCRRYFKRLGPWQSGALLIGRANSATAASFIVGDEPMAKQTGITATVTGTVNIRAGDNTNHAVTAASALSTYGGGVYVELTTTGLTAYASALLVLGANSYLDISADL